VTKGSHTPIRSCMGCGGRDAQSGLIRILCDASGKLAVVSGRQHEGRTGYLHASEECYKRFAARKGPLRSLRHSVDRNTRLALVAELQLQDPGGVRR